MGHPPAHAAAGCRTDPKPIFHVAPPQGWLNDPNGPIYYGGYYHIFYQYVERGCSWDWGLCWGHAVSRDLATWQHLPPALAPTFGGFDGDGCFSGCATLDVDGTPTILYTGVRLRSSSVCGPLPPPECDLGTACIETQCMAFGDPADPKLTYWTKEETPFLSLPPPAMNLTAWRDPFVIGRPDPSNGCGHWTVMVGAGIRDRGGSALVYRSSGDSLRTSTWSFAGELCRGCGDTGVIWECPVLVDALPLAPPAACACAAAGADAAGGDVCKETVTSLGPILESLQDHQEQAARAAAAVSAVGAGGDKARGEVPSRPVPLHSPRPAAPASPHPALAPPAGAGAGGLYTTASSSAPLIPAVISPFPSPVTSPTRRRRTLPQPGPIHLYGQPPDEHHTVVPVLTGSGSSHGNTPLNHTGTTNTSNESNALSGSAAAAAPPSPPAPPSPRPAGLGGLLHIMSPRRAAAAAAAGLSTHYLPGSAPITPLARSPRALSPSPFSMPLGSPRGVLSVGPLPHLPLPPALAHPDLAPHAHPHPLAAPPSPLRSPLRLVGPPPLTTLLHAPSPPAPRPAPLLSPQPAPGGGFILPPRPPAAHRPAPTPLNTPAPPAAAAAAAAVGTSLLSPSRRLLPTAISCSPPTGNDPATDELLASLMRDAAAARSPAAAAAAARTPGPTPALVPPTSTIYTAEDSWQRHRAFFCICPDDCNSMAVYYLGSHDPAAAAFDLAGALGPHPVDLGDIYYAPQALVDPQGRAVLWGWLQEKPRKVGSYDYAGCLTMPRLMYLQVEDGAVTAAEQTKAGAAQQQQVYLVQAPPPEIAKLRVPGSEWSAEGLSLPAGTLMPLPLCGGRPPLHVEVNLAMRPHAPPPPHSPARARRDSHQQQLQRTAHPHDLAEGSGGLQGGNDAGVDGGAEDGAEGAAGPHCSGLLLHSWSSGSEGSAALLYHWASGLLEVVFEALDPATLTFSLGAPGARRVGGPLRRPPAPGEPLQLRVFLDYSVLEVFTAQGEVLTTRVYRGTPPAGPGGGTWHGGHGGQQQGAGTGGGVPGSPGGSVRSGGVGGSSWSVGGGGAEAGVELVSFGGSTEFVSVEAHEMGCMWVDEV